jgi:hypothetical protein
MKVFSLYILLLSAYNPYTSYVFNSTGFHGGELHQVLMVFGMVLFLVVNMRVVITHIKNIEVVSLLFILMFLLFAFLNSNVDSNVNERIAGVAFVLEFYLFYVIGSRVRYIMPMENAYLIFFRVLLINAVCVIGIWFFMSTHMYFRLDFGGAYVARVLDFITGLFLILMFVKPIKLSKTLLTSQLYWVVSLFAIVVGFSRAVWLSLFLTYMIYFFITGMKNGLRVSAKKIVAFLVLFIFCSIVLYVSGIYEYIEERFVLNNPDESSYTGRIEAYLSLLYGTFSSVKNLLFGQGIGANMPGLDIPVSSSPSFPLSFLYTNGIVISLIFILVLIYMAFILLNNFMMKKDMYSLYGFLLFIYFFIVLNIFPSVSHYPIFGYLGFIVGMSLKVNKILAR